MSRASPAGTGLCTQSSICTTLKLFSELPHLAGQIYNYLIDGYNGITKGLKSAQERDLGVMYEDEEWNIRVKEMLNPMRDARSKLI